MFLEPAVDERADLSFPARIERLDVQAGQFASEALGAVVADLGDPDVLLRAALRLHGVSNLLLQRVHHLQCQVVAVIQRCGQQTDRLEQDRFAVSH
jgi:hypothetical protein